MLAAGATLLGAAVFLCACEERVTDPGPQAAVEAISLAPLAASVTLEDGDGFTRGLGEKAGALIEVIRPIPGTAIWCYSCTGPCRSTIRSPCGIRSNGIHSRRLMRSWRGVTG
jgi:hypothetical protein